MKPTSYIYIVRTLSLFTKTTFFPFFAIWLIYEHILSASSTAIVVSIAVFSYRIAALLFARLTRRYSQKNVSAIAMIALAISYTVVYLFAAWGIDSLVFWCAAAFCIGSSIAIAIISQLSLLTLTQAQQHHLKGFAMANIAMNISSGLGPLIGAYVYSHYPDYIALVPAFFALLTLFAWIKLPDAKPQATIKTTAINFKTNKSFVFLLVINFLTLIGFAQMYDVFPLAAKQYFDVKLIGLFFFFSAILIVVLQTPMMTLYKRFNHTTLLVVGNALAALGILFFTLLATQSILACSLAIGICTVAELFYVPIYQTLAVQLYKPHDSLLALAWLTFAWGMGEAAGAYIGINLVSHVHENYSFIFAAIAAVLAIILIILGRPYWTAASTA